MRSREKKRSFFWLSLCLGMGSFLSPFAEGQEAFVEQGSWEAIVSSADQKRLDKQAAEFFQVLDKLSQTRAGSVVSVWRGRRLVALGSVVKKGKVLTKWSDLSLGRGELRVVNAKGQAFRAKTEGGNRDFDLAILSVPGLQASVLDFTQTASVEEGDFIFSVLPSGQAGDFGVVSVKARSLRESDLPYLGITTYLGERGKGVFVEEVHLNSGAHKAGLLPGDRLLFLAGKPLESPLSIRALLKDKKPGESIALEWMRGQKTHTASLVLGARPAEQKYEPKRLEAMNAMGNPMSLRRDGFPWVIQSDMTLPPSHAGAPVYNLEGKLVGVALARAGRIESYIVPIDLVWEALGAKASS